MVSIDTFLIALYVLVDEFCKRNPPAVSEQTIWACGRKRALSRSEVVTLSILGQWYRFRSERDFWRFCDARMRELFPDLPDRSEFVRAQQRFEPTVVAFGLDLARQMGAEEAPYEVIDRCGVATRMCGRRGRDWLGGYANKGLCGRLGFFFGFQLMCSVSDTGVITGFGFAPGSTKDQPMAESLFSARYGEGAKLHSAGVGGRSRFYVVDKGFSGPKRKRFWKERYGAEVVGAPQKGHGPAWPREWQEWVCSVRQIIETVHDKLLNFFRLESERPHAIRGFQVRLAAKVALHNFCIWLNRSLGRPSLQFADLLGW
jgi:hypothetical protein